MKRSPQHSLGLRTMVGGAVDVLCWSSFVGHDECKRCNLRMPNERAGVGNPLLWTQNNACFAERWWAGVCKCALVLTLIPERIKVGVRFEACLLIKGLTHL